MPANNLYERIEKVLLDSRKCWGDNVGLDAEKFTQTVEDGLSDLLNDIDDGMYQSAD